MVTATHPSRPLAGAATPGCPVRKLRPQGDRPGPPVEQVEESAEERWVIRSFDTARQVIRDSDSVRQAGFAADNVHRASARMRPPILYLEGLQHRKQRKAAARLFAPKVVEGYREMMEQLSDHLVASVRADRPIDLSRLSWRMAAQVTAQVVGLTNSSVTAMSSRLNAFFEGDPMRTGWDPRSMVRLLRTQSALLRFFTLDVKPAIRARRRNPGEDVISQLIAQDFNDVDILTECVTYGAAGMVTTREFITVAAWYLLDDAVLLDRYRRVDIAERLQILEEILRLEPVVGHLYRRTVREVALPGPDAPTLAVGTLIDLDVRAINIDSLTVGADASQLCPGRNLPSSVPPPVMSFGDGNHRCPGAPLAIMEAEIFLSTLLKRDLVFNGPPTIQWNHLSAGYDLDDFIIRLRS